jgi:arylsulfatase A-like enzyme
MPKPNILLLFTDMQRADTIHALGNPVIKTPHLDTLVREGVSFVNAYSPSPVCVPARCSMHYGAYPFTTGCADNGPMPADNGRSYAAALGNAGYRTHAIGKCHFTPDKDALRGFQSRESQEEIVKDPASDDYLRYIHAKGYRYVCDPHGCRGEMYYIPQVSPFPAQHHPTQWIGDRSIAFIREAAQGGKPWHLFASFIHPHPPLNPPNPWHKLYRAALMPLPYVPQDYEALYTWINRNQNRYKYRDQGIDNNLVRAIKAHYYACISFVDFQIGRIRQALADTNQLDNTLIVFSSDHGEYLGDLNCFGKRGMHNPAAKIPLIAHMPGLYAGGRISETPVSLVDIAPTLLEAGGVPGDGLALEGEALSRHVDSRDRFVYSQFNSQARGIYMIANRRWKYFYSAADQREFLFNLETDPQEARNQAGLPFPEQRAALRLLRQTLLEKLVGTQSGGAVEKNSSGELAWKIFEPSALERRQQVIGAVSPSPDPDEGLLIQDHPWADYAIPGYTDGSARVD